VLGALGKQRKARRLALEPAPPLVPDPVFP